MIFTGGQAVFYAAGAVHSRERARDWRAKSLILSASVGGLEKRIVDYILPDAKLRVIEIQDSWVPRACVPPRRAGEKRSGTTFINNAPSATCNNYT